MPQISWHLKKVLSPVHQKPQAATGLCAIAKLTVSAELIGHIAALAFADYKIMTFRCISYVISSHRRP